MPQLHNTPTRPLQPTIYPQTADRKAMQNPGPSPAGRTPLDPVLCRQRARDRGPASSSAAAPAAACASPLLHTHAQTRRSSSPHSSLPVTKKTQCSAVSKYARRAHMPSVCIAARPSACCFGCLIICVLTRPNSPCQCAANKAATAQQVPRCHKLHNLSQLPLAHAMCSA